MTITETTGTNRGKPLRQPRRPVTSWSGGWHSSPAAPAASGRPSAPAWPLKEQRSPQDLAVTPPRQKSSPTDFRQQFGTTATVHRGNVASADDCRRVIAEVIEQHGRLDILVNNAGITIDKTVLKLTTTTGTRCWTSTSPARSSSPRPHCATWWNAAAAASSTSHPSSARSATSDRPTTPPPNPVSSDSPRHSPGKPRFISERAGKLSEDSVGVTVNTVTPGYTATEMVAAVPEKVLNKIKAQIPLRRLGRPEEIARIVHFLAADASSYITGQVWGVNGGMDM